MQTELEILENRPVTVRTYKVQKYKIFYTKEKDFFAPTIYSRNDAFEFSIKYLSELPYENCLFIALNTANKIIGYNSAEGTTDQCAVYIKNVFTFLLSCGANGFIVAHNHPGGATKPSEADWALTERLRKAGMLLEIKLFDHLIVPEGSDEAFSMRDLPRWNNN